MKLLPSRRSLHILYERIMCRKYYGQIMLLRVFNAFSYCTAAGADVVIKTPVTLGRRNGHGRLDGRGVSVSRTRLYINRVETSSRRRFDFSINLCNLLFSHRYIYTYNKLLRYYIVFIQLCRVYKFEWKKKRKKSIQSGRRETAPFSRTFLSKSRFSEFSPISYGFYFSKRFLL